MTTIYLIRHSKTFKPNSLKSDDNFQIQNEKYSLSIEGENIAKEKLSNPEFNNIDIIYSSNYVRAIQTAKYLSEKNNLNINLINDLGERKIGINSWEELPENYERIQLLDDNYKINNGESQKEVRERMYKTILEILDNNKNKRIAIISHGTAISFLLKKWVNINIENNKMKYTYKGITILHNYLNYCETFKLEFDDNKKLINLSRINL